MNDDKIKSLGEAWLQWSAEEAEAQVSAPRNRPNWRRTHSVAWWWIRHMSFWIMWSIAWAVFAVPRLHLKDGLLNIGLTVVVGFAVYLFGLFIYQE